MRRTSILKRSFKKGYRCFLVRLALSKLVLTLKLSLKKKKDRVEDAIYAVKAALKQGIVPGGGIALLNASQKIEPTNVGEKAIIEAIQAPFKTIMSNAGIESQTVVAEGLGIDVVTGDVVDMVKAGIIDPSTRNKICT